MVTQLQKIHLERPEEQLFGSVVHTTGLQGVDLNQMPEAVEVAIARSLQFATRKRENEKCRN
jgi:hypothetical protein